MKPWVEDIIQALENLGGQAHRRDIINELRRIRTEPLPLHLDETFQERIQAYSSDSAHFQNRGDYFKKIGNGIWALRDQVEQHKIIVVQDPKNNASTHQVSRVKVSTFENNKSNNSWVVDIVQALTNLGGEAHRKEIIEEVKRIRTGPLPLRLEETIQRTIQNNSSDSKGFKGTDLFKKMGNGVWKLRDIGVDIQPLSPSPRKKSGTQSNNRPPESLEEIASILRTIKEYREYYDPKSPNWREYIASLFQILGFSTDNVHPLVMKLHAIGSNEHVKALVWNTYQEDDREVFWLSEEWEKIAVGIAEVNITNWMLVTNGLYLKMIQYKGRKVFKKFFWQEFDTIVCQEQIDTFYQIYKVFALIKADD